MRETEHRRLLDWILILIVASMIWGMLQFAGLDIEDPFINQTPGAVSACFANRNHFALFLALGCLLAPVWAGRDGIHARGRALIALALILLFVLTILATGSRAGLMLAALALCTDFWLVGAELRAALQRRPRWFACLLALLSGGALAGLVTLSFFLDRAESINRVLQNNAEQDMRAQALPTVMQMIRSYFPSGSGFGSFDPLFRMHEPFSLLNLSYFNHAHNDFLEITLEGGLPAIILLIAGIGWWIFATVGLPKAGTCRSALARLGSGMLLLTLAASTFDYPARTPTIMALVTLAAFWLAREGRRALPVIPPDL
jgi:O-antigen ligase